MVDLSIMRTRFSFFMLLLFLMILLFSCKTINKKETKIFSRDIIENHGIYWISIGDKAELLLSILGKPDYVFHNEFYLDYAYKKNLNNRSKDIDLKQEELTKKFVDKYSIYENRISIIDTLTFGLIYRDEDNFIIFDNPFFRSALAFYDLGLFVFLDDNEKVIKTIALVNDFDFDNSDLKDINYFDGRLLVGDFSTDENFNFSKERYLEIENHYKNKKSKDTFSLFFIDEETTDNSLIFLSTKKYNTYIDFYNDNMVLVSISLSSFDRDKLNSFKQHFK
jgi:hypothetical protein